MNDLGEEINKAFLKFNIPFVDYGITSSDSIFIPFGFTYKDGRVKAYSLNEELRLETTQSERAESYLVPGTSRQLVGEGTSNVRIVIAGDDSRSGNSTTVSDGVNRSH